MAKSNELARKHYEAALELPEGERTLLAELLRRNSVTIPLVGSHVDSSALAARPGSCRRAATYLVGGMGRMSNGKETFSLKNRICLAPIPEMPINENPRDDRRYVLLDSYYFVAAPADGQPVLVSTSAEKAVVPIEPGYYVVDINSQSREEVDIKILVQGFGVDGKPKSAEYHWHCLVEVGVFGFIGG